MQIISVALLAIDVATRERGLGAVVAPVAGFASASPGEAAAAAAAVVVGGLGDATVTLEDAGAPFADTVAFSMSASGGASPLMQSSGGGGFSGVGSGGALAFEAASSLSHKLTELGRRPVPALLPPALLLRPSKGFESPVMSLTLMFTTAGYAVCQLLWAVLCMASEAMAAHSPSLRVFRSGWLLLLSLLTALCSLLTVTQGPLRRGLSAVIQSDSLRDVGDSVRWVLPFQLGSWPQSWHAALTCVALFALCTFASQYLAQSSPLLAPLVADVVLRRPLAAGVAASPHSPYRSAALTFNGAPTPEQLPQLLQLLASHGALATFFLDAATVQRDAATVEALLQAGHEVGCLGLAGAHWSSEIAADIARTRDALESHLAAVRAKAANGGLLSPCLGSPLSLGPSPLANASGFNAAAPQTAISQQHKQGQHLHGGSGTVITAGSSTSTGSGGFTPSAGAAAGSASAASATAGAPHPPFAAGPSGGGSSPRIRARRASAGAAALAAEMAAFSLAPVPEPPQLSAVAAGGAGGAAAGTLGPLSGGSSGGIESEIRGPHASSGAASGHRSPRGRSASPARASRVAAVHAAQAGLQNGTAPAALEAPQPGLSIAQPVAMPTAQLQQRVAWFRPQDASRDMIVLRAANAAGLRVCLWTATPYDWCARLEQVSERLTDQLGGPELAPGAIIQLHVTLPDWLQAPAAARWPKHDPLCSTAETLALLRRWDITGVTLSALLGSHVAAAKHRFSID